LGKATVRVDMHLHTHRSFDCLSSPDDILRAARARGIDHVIITDHNEIRGALELKEADPERVIVGEEVKTREGFDVIGIFVQELIPKGTPARETCRRVRDQGGVVYLPHPFDGSRAPDPKQLEALLEWIDVVEVHNARCWPGSLNGRAREWAVARGKLMGAGSDAHTIREIGRGFVDLPPFRFDRESFLTSLRHAVPGGQLTSPLLRLASNWAKLRNLPKRRASPTPGSSRQEMGT
jgi:predicted metal-dependent phosphoesterase TrpH